MFADKNVTAMVPAKDYARAKKWYADTLGLLPSDEVGEGVGGSYLAAEGTRFFIYTTPLAGTAEHTIITFDTKDIAADMRMLRDKGVAFIEYDQPNLKTVDGLAQWGPVKNCWFKDSEGNVIGLVEGM